MSKELEAFMDILEILSSVTGCDVDTDSEHIKIVQQALLELQSIKKAKPSEALECLEDLFNDYKELCLDTGSNEHTYHECNLTSPYNTIKQALLNAEKEHKALEIIKEKEVNMQVFNQCEDVETYNKVYIKQKDRQLTQEEFDSVNMVLRNE